MTARGARAPRADGRRCTTTRTAQRVRLSGLTRCSLTVACAVAGGDGRVGRRRREQHVPRARRRPRPPKPVAAAGVGTEAAKNAPYCDPKDGQLAIPYQKRPPCVRPMKAGESNGGATSPGVTKDAIKVVVVVPTQEQQRATWSNAATPPPMNHATNSPGYVEDAAADWLTVLSRSFQTWGRTDRRRPSSTRRDRPKRRSAPTRSRSRR